MKTLVEKNLPAKEYFENVLLKSWTYNKMTAEEQGRLKQFVYRILDGHGGHKLAGTAEQRREQMCLLYSAYLAGLGYVGGVSWRETGEDIPQF